VKKSEIASHVFAMTKFGDFPTGHCEHNEAISLLRISLPRVMIILGLTNMSAWSSQAAQNCPSSTVGVRLFLGRHLITLVVLYSLLLFCDKSEWFIER